MYLTRGDLNKYIAKLRLLHEIDGENQDYLTDLAQCIIDNDLIEQTIKEGNRALNAKILKQLIKRGVSNDRTIGLYEKLIKVEPDNAVIRRALATAHENRKEYGKSLQHLLVLIRHKPDDDELCRRAAGMAVEQELLSQVLVEGGAALLIATALEIAERKIGGPVAREIMEAALRERPDDTRILSHLKTLKPPAPPPPVIETKPEVDTAAKPHDTEDSGQRASESPSTANLEELKPEPVIAEIAELEPQ